MTFTVCGPLMFAYMVGSIKRGKQTLLRKTIDIKMILRYSQQLQTWNNIKTNWSHHKLQAIVHRKEPTSKILRRLQVLQNSHKETCTTFTSITTVWYCNNRIICWLWFAIKYHHLLRQELSFSNFSVENYSNCNLLTWCLCLTTTLAQWSHMPIKDCNRAYQSSITNIIEKRNRMDKYIWEQFSLVVSDS